MPTFPALNVQSLDVPRMFAIGSQISGNKTRNKLAEAQLLGVERENTMLSQQGALREQYVGADDGDQSQIGAEMLANNPAAAKFLESYAAMDDREKEQKRETTLTLAAAAEWADNPMKWERAKGFLGPEAKGYLYKNRDKLIEEGRLAKAIMDYADEGGPDEGTSVMQNAAALGLEPGTPEYNDYVRQVTMKPGVSVAIQNTQEGAFEKKYGETTGTYYAELFTGLQTGAREGRQQNAQLDRLDQLLDQAYTGTFAGTVTKVQRAVETIPWLAPLKGVISGDAAPGEAAMALSNEMALQLRNPAGGAGMPGSLSDKDREFLQSMVPGLGQTREGRKLLIRARKKLNRRNEDIARIARDYQKKHGFLDEGFEQDVEMWARDHPLFEAEDMTALEKARLPKPADAAERAALPPGTYYMAPDGSIRQVPQE